MKKIINGKMYNTETAKELGYDRSAGVAKNDFNYWEETLYLKKNGKYFLYCYGGANTSFGVPCGNNHMSSGRDFIPMNESEAKDWVERHLDADKYIEIFGEPEE